MTATGTTAPAFSLTNRDGETRTLAQHRGGPVVLVFFPFAFSPVCTDELCHLQDHAETFEEFGATVLCISTDSHYALDAFARQESYDFELLSDHWPHGEAARAFGVFDERLGCARRASFLVDADGWIVWRALGELPQSRDLDDHVRAAQNLV